MKLDAGMTAVITGAASGIGLALAHAVADRGLNVVLADRDESRLSDATATLPAGGGRHLAVATDVSDAGSVDALAATVAAEFGPVQLLVNNAGILRLGSAYEQPLEDWNAVFAVNVYGIIHGFRSFVPSMLAHGRPSHVLNTASLGGLVAAPQSAIYLVSKHAAIALSESLAADTAGTELGVTVLCPGGVATDIFTSEARRRQADGVRSSTAAEEHLARISDPGRSDVAEPAAVAQVALDAVERGELYAFTFDAPRRESVRRRLAAIEHAMQVDEARSAAPVPQSH